MTVGDDTAIFGCTCEYDTLMCVCEGKTWEGVYVRFDCWQLPWVMGSWLEDDHRAVEEVVTC